MIFVPPPLKKKLSTGKNLKTCMHECIYTHTHTHTHHTHTPVTGGKYGVGG